MPTTIETAAQGETASPGDEPVPADGRAPSGETAPLGGDASPRAKVATTPLQASRAVFGATAKVADTYRQAVETTTGDVQALAASWANLGRGMQQMQSAWLDMGRQVTEQMRTRPQALLSCRSPEELATVQRDIYMDAVSGMLHSTTMLLQLSSQIAQDAVQPLADRAGRRERR